MRWYFICNSPPPNVVQAEREETSRYKQLALQKWKKDLERMSCLQEGTDLVHVGNGCWKMKKGILAKFEDHFLRPPSYLVGEQNVLVC